MIDKYTVLITFPELDNGFDKVGQIVRGSAPSIDGCVEIIKGHVKNHNVDTYSATIHKTKEGMRLLNGLQEPRNKPAVKKSWWRKLLRA